MVEDTLNLNLNTGVPAAPAAAVPAIAASPAAAPKTNPAPAPAPPPAPAHNIEHTVEAVAKQIESYLRSSGRSLEFYVDQSTHRTVVTVRDAATGEIIRQIPPEEVQRLAQSLQTQQPSTLIDMLA